LGDAVSAVALDKSGAGWIVSCNALELLAL
jgi:hypothetical protein